VPVARKRQRWQRVDRKDLHLEHLRPRAELRAVDQTRAVRDADDAVGVLLGDVINADE